MTEEYTLARLHEVNVNIDRLRTAEDLTYPFRVMILVIVLAWIGTAAQAWWESEQDRHLMADTIAACANGAMVGFGENAAMTCEVVEFVEGIK